METMFQLMTENEDRRRKDDADREERAEQRRQTEKKEVADREERRRKEKEEAEERRAEREEQRRKEERDKHEELLLRMQQQQQDDRDRQFQMYEILQAQIQSNQAVNGNGNGNGHVNGSGTKTPPCENFTGESKVPEDNDFAEWLKQFEEAATLMGYSPQQKLKWLLMKMKGSARTTAYTLNDAERQDWDTVVNLLKKRFQDGTTVTSRYRKLFDRRMESGETKRQLFTDIQRLTKEATSKEPLSDSADETCVRHCPT